MARKDKATGLISRGIYLKWSATSSGTYTEIPDLQEIPDLGSSPDTIEVTTLEDGSKRYIKGLKDYGSLDFTFLYTGVPSGGYAVCRDIEALTKPAYFDLVLPDGCSFKFTGMLTTIINGVGTNDAITFTASIALNSDMVVTESTDGAVLPYNEGTVGE